MVAGGGDGCLVSRSHGVSGQSCWRSHHWQTRGMCNRCSGIWFRQFMWPMQWLECVLVCTRLEIGSIHHFGELPQGPATMFFFWHVHIPNICDNIHTAQSRLNMPK